MPVTGVMMVQHSKHYKRNQKCEIKPRSCKHKQKLDINTGDEGEMISVYSG